MKKTVALILAATLLASVFLTGCGGKKEDKSLTKVKEAGVLVLGLDDSFPPMGFRDEDQNIVGFDIDVATEVCKRMGIELKTQPINWDTKDQELDTGNVDCIWNGYTYTEKKAKNQNLTDAYMKNTQTVVVLADSPINTVADLKGKTVAVQAGSTAEEVIDGDADLKKSIGEIVPISDYVKAMMDLSIGGSDAVVMDEVVARYYAGKDPGKYKILEETLADEEYVVAFRKNDQALRDEVQKQLTAIMEDGTMKTIAMKWFGKDVTLKK